MSELTAMSRAEPPPNNLPGFEVQYDCQVVLFVGKPQMSEILHPTTRFSHAGVAEACLRLGFVTKHRKAFQSIGCGSYLCRHRTSIALLFVWSGNGDAGNCTDTPGLYLAPAEMQCESAHTVERVLVVRLPKVTHRLFISSDERKRMLIVATP